MPFDMHGDVVLTRDVPEHGVRAGDIGTVVERHVVPGVSEEGYSVEFLVHDRQHGGRGHAAGQRPSVADAGRSSGRPGAHRLKPPGGITPPAARHRPSAASP